MKDAKNACNEYGQLSRRQVLAAGAFAATLPAWMPKVAFAQDPGAVERDVLIYVILRGGADALSMIVPHGDPVYYSSRPNIAVPQPGNGANSAVDINGYFGWHPKLAGLAQPMAAGHLAAIHAVGRENWSFSHFDAQAWIEQGSVSPGAGGWLARHLASVNESKNDAEIRAYQFGNYMPTSLHGMNKVMLGDDPSKVEFGGWLYDVDAEVQKTLLRQYMRMRDRSRDTLRDGVRAAALLNQLNLNTYVATGGANYADTYLARSLKSTAAMMKAEAGIEVFHLDTFGWDTHVQQGTVDGDLNEKLDELNNAMVSFYQDMMSAGKTRWTMVVHSEFGRRVNENGSLGTEHGQGGMMLIMSPHLAQSGVITQWPGLAVEQRGPHDTLRPTIDDRTIISDLLRNRLGNSNVSFVLPEFSETPNSTLFEAAA